VRLLAPVVLVAALAAGCGAGTKGSAAVWVTRDRGAHVLLVAKVPAGLTAMQALRRVTKVKTRYGGRFVQSIDGLSGSATAQRDWFYFVNGYEADRGAAEYRLHDGDVEWWDYRSWAAGEATVPVVVGAFPEPFLHGYAGKRLSALVVSGDPQAARAVAKVLHARVAGAYEQTRDTNVLVLAEGSPARFKVVGDSRAGGSVVFAFSGDWHELVDGKYRYRYSVP
jgi:hypothetical protein